MLGSSAEMIFFFCLCSRRDERRAKAKSENMFADYKTWPNQGVRAIKKCVSNLDVWEKERTRKNKSQYWPRGAPKHVEFAENEKA